MKKKAITLILSLVLVTGCGGSAEEQLPSATPVPANQEEEQPKPAYGGTIKLSMRAPVTFNPLTNEDVTVDNVLKLVFEPLAMLDNSQKPVPNLAESLSFSSDGMNVIVTLKDNIFWEDGQKITSKDLVYSLETLRNAPERAIYKTCMANVLSFSSIDERNVKINYIQPFGGSAYLLCFPLIPEHFYKTAETMDIMGNGLYKSTGFDIQTGLKLTASETAFGTKPYIQNVVVKVSSDKETDLYSFEQDMTDVVATNIVDWSKYLNVTDASVTDCQTTYFDFIGFNFENTAFQDLSVRKAIASAIDREKILTQVYLGHGSIANAPVNPESWLYEPDMDVMDFNLEKAAEYLDSVEMSSLSALGILVNKENDERMKIASMLADNLAELGITATIESESFDAYQKRLELKEFDLVIAGFNMSLMPELGFAFSSSPERAPQNYFSYKNEQMDMLLDRVFAASSESRYKEAVQELQMFFADELPCISLVFRKSVLLADKRIYGEKTPTVSNMFYGAEQWFVVEN